MTYYSILVDRSGSGYVSIIEVRDYNGEDITDTLDKQSEGTLLGRDFTGRTESEMIDSVRSYIAEITGTDPREVGIDFQD